jgi:hypothetical protein
MCDATPTPLGRSITAWLAHQRCLGRGYNSEQWVLTHLQRFLTSINAVDLDQAGFDCWCASFAHLSPTTRRAVSWPSASSVSSDSEQNRLASYRTHSTLPGCARIGAP